MSEPTRVVLSDFDNLDGLLMTPASPGYDDARRVWNGMIDRHPAAIVRCASERDVQITVAVARERGLDLAVRGGGHGVAGFSTVEAGIVLDLAGLATVEVDPQRRVATVGGGATWADVDAATAKYGLATTGGLVSTTGVGGLTLGGGIGWLTRYCGLACDNMVSARLVTADGQTQQIGPASDAELWWALRGGGGNFGVVTSFELALHPVGPIVGGLMLFPIDRLTEVGSTYRDWAAGLSNSFTTMMVLLTGPDDPELPESVRGQACVAIAGCHVETPDVADADLQPIRALGPAADLFDVMPYPLLQQMFDADLPAGRRSYFTGVFTHGCPDQLLDALHEAAATWPSAGCEIDLHHMGGAAGQVPVDATAFSGRTAAYTANIYGCWDDPDDDSQHMEWARRTAESIRPIAADGNYVNFMGDAAEAGGVQTAYGASRYNRLRAVKRRLDPDNLFHLNQNIRP